MRGLGVAFSHESHENLWNHSKHPATVSILVGDGKSLMFTARKIFLFRVPVDTGFPISSITKVM